MANRAYLYAANAPDSALERDGEQRCWDSRNDIPLAWFFFFKATDAKLVPVETWFEVRVAARRESALGLFEERAAILRQLTAPWIESCHLDRLGESIGGMAEEWLVLDPNEVLQGDDAEICSGLVTLLETLDASQCETTSDDQRALLLRYSNVLSHAQQCAPERVICSIVGTTYWE